MHWVYRYPLAIEHDIRIRMFFLTDMLLKIYLFIVLPFIFFEDSDRFSDGFSPNRQSLSDQRYADIIRSFEKTAPKESEENAISEEKAILGLALLQQARVYNVFFEFSTALLTDYADHRDNLDTQNRTSLNDLYKSLSLLYRKDSRAGRYAQRFLESPSASAELRSIAEFASGSGTRDKRSALHHILSWMHGSNQGVPDQCTEQDAVWQSRCLFLRDFQNISATGPVFPPRFEDRVPTHRVTFDSYTTIEYPDPADLFLLSMFRYEQLYAIWKNEPILQGRNEMVEAAYETGRYKEALELISKASVVHPLHPLYLAAIRYHTTGRDQYFDELRSYLSSGNSRQKAVAAKLLTELELDQNQRKKVLTGILAIPLSGQTEATYIGWSLLRLNAPEQALQRLEAHYKRSYHNNVRSTPHKMLALLSYARYLSGREHYAESLSHYVALSRNEYPLIRPFLPILQETVMPECPECGIVR